MRVLGMMSGTSADGIDVALVEIAGAPPRISAKFQGHYHVRFPAAVRAAILRLANGEPTTTAEISQLNFLLGEEFARAAIESCRSWRVPMRQISLIGSHGQTIFHQGVPARFLGARRVASTLQIGEPEHHCRAHGRDDDCGFSSGGHGRWRRRSSASSVCRLSFVPAQTARASCAEHRRNCERHRGSRERTTRGRIRVRHRAGKYDPRRDRGIRHARAQRDTIATRK